jgi:hypothetical protein
MTLAPLIEAAVDTFDDALAAETESVDRIELCGPLHDGGTTPSADLWLGVWPGFAFRFTCWSWGSDFVYATRKSPDAGGYRSRVEPAPWRHGALTPPVIDVAAGRVGAEARPMRVGFTAHSTVHDVQALEALVLLGVDLIHERRGAGGAEGGIGCALVSGP